MNEKLFFRLYRSSHFIQVYERDIVDCNITIQGIFILLEPGIDAFVSFGSLFECVQYAVCCEQSVEIYKFSPNRMPKNKLTAL